MKKVRLDTESIHDWQSFHEIFKRVMGFPDFYGANMDAWIDCMSYLDDPRAGMSQITLEPGEMLVLEVSETEASERHRPEQFREMIICTASVKQALCGAHSIVDVVVTWALTLELNIAII